MSLTRHASQTQEPEPQRGNASFLVRIWWEVRDQLQDPPLWRGRIEHVPSGWAAHFDDVAGLLAGIECWTGKLTADDKDP